MIKITKKDGSQIVVNSICDPSSEDTEDSAEDTEDTEDSAEDDQTLDRKIRDFNNDQGVRCCFIGLLLVLMILSLNLDKMIAYFMGY